jgi:hypothetical protein
MKANRVHSSDRTDTAPAPAEVVRLHRGPPPGRENAAVLLPVGPGIGPSHVVGDGVTLVSSADQTAKDVYRVCTGTSGGRARQLERNP